MNLFELSANYKRLLDELMREDEITPELMNQFNAIDGDLDEKILNYSSIIKTLDANAKAIAEQVAHMEKRAAAMIRKSAWLKDIIKNQMSACNKKNIENEYHSVTLCQNNPRVDDFDKDLIPKEFWKIKVKESVELSKTDILKALKENIPVPGARLVRDYRVNIR